MTLLTIDLRAEATAEVERLNAARALARQDNPGDPGDPGDPGNDLALAQLEGDGAWIIVVRSPALRRTLGRRALLLWRVACEDAGGRIVESHLVAIAVQLSGTCARVRQRTRIEALVRAIEHEAVDIVERSSDEWRIAVERTIRAFTSVRAARVRAVANNAATPDPRLFQPGLFDRRATRAVRTAEERPDAIQPAAATAGRPQLRLVVVP